MQKKPDKITIPNTQLYNLITQKLIRNLKKTLRESNTTTFISHITKNETSITLILPSVGVRRPKKKNLNFDKIYLKNYNSHR